MSTASSPLQRDPRRAFVQRGRFMSLALLVLFLIGWICWFWPYDDLLDRSGTPLGADFSMFYVSGQVVATGNADRLYDQAEHQSRLHRLFPGIDAQFALPYRYPPLVAWLMAPLASLPYAVALVIFMTLGLAGALIGIRLLVRQNVAASASCQSLCWLALLGWPVFLETWVGGQASLFALLIVCTGVVLMQREQFEWAGAVWALAAYKPNVMLLVVIGCVLFRPRVLRGLIPVGAGLFACTWWTAGWTDIIQYVELTRELTAQPWNVATPFWKVHGIAPWLALLIGDQAKLVSLLLGALATVGIVWRWRMRRNVASSPLPYAVLITVNALANPYTPIYDLTLLSASLVLMAPTLAESGRFSFAKYPGLWQVIFGLIFLGPHLSQAVAKASGLQMFPLLLIVLTACQGWLFWRETAPQTSAGCHDLGDEGSRIAGELSLAADGRP